MFLAMLNAMISFGEKNPVLKAQSNSFEALLNEKGITVTGTGGALSGSKVASIVDDESPEVAQRFSEATRNANTMKTYTSVELLELQYYTLPQEERDRFLDEAANNTIKIKLTEKGTIFSSLSYGFKTIDDPF